MRKLLLPCLCLAVLAGCKEREAAPEAKATELATRFANAYFNLDFEKARPLVTADSEKWLRFMASNITQADIDLVNGQEGEAVVVAEGCERVNDSTLAVTVVVSNYLRKDSLEAAGRIADDDRYVLVAVERSGSYAIRMEGLPRSGRQSRD